MALNDECDLKICDLGMARLEASPEEELVEGSMSMYVCTRWYLLPAESKGYNHKLTSFEHFVLNFHCFIVVSFSFFFCFLFFFFRGPPGPPSSGRRQTFSKLKGPLNGISNDFKHTPPAAVIRNRGAKKSSTQKT